MIDVKSLMLVQSTSKLNRVFDAIEWQLNPYVGNYTEEELSEDGQGDSWKTYRITRNGSIKIGLSVTQ